MTDDVTPLLKVHEYFRGVSDAGLREVARAARVTQHAAGEVVHEANAPLTTVGFVLRGRLKAGGTFDVYMVDGQPHYRPAGSEVPGLQLVTV